MNITYKAPIAEFHTSKLWVKKLATNPIKRFFFARGCSKIVTFREIDFGGHFMVARRYKRHFRGSHFQNSLSKGPCTRPCYQPNVAH